jgi:hypothetical protein
MVNDLQCIVRNCTFHSSFCNVHTHVHARARAHTHTHTHTHTRARAHELTRALTATDVGCRYTIHIQHSGSDFAAQFVRLSVNQVTTSCRGLTDGRARIIEMEVMGTLAAAGTALGGIPVVNVALNKQVLVDSVLAGFPGELAVDGDTTR